MRRGPVEGSLRWPIEPATMPLSDPDVTQAGPRSGGSLHRAARRAHARMVPEPVRGEPGLFVVDGTWGTVAPIGLGNGVRTVGELEVVGHVRAGGDLIDTRAEHFHRAGTIPGARGIPHATVVERIDELDAARPTVFFCNGPQCTATPQAVRALLGAGYPAGAILYYRGGIHDWMTLGFPVVAPGAIR